MSIHVDVAVWVMSAKKWILFDVGGVLEAVDDDAWQQEWWERWRAVSGLDVAAFDARIAGAELPAIDVTVGTEPAFWAAVGAALELDDEQCAAMRADSGMRTAAPETSS